MNDVKLDGRLTRDAEIRQAGSSRIAKFTIAQTERKKQGTEWVDDGSSFYDVEYWLHDHDDLSKFVKGQIIYFEGRLKQDKWEKDGRTQSKVKIVVKNILGWNWANAKGGSSAPPASPNHLAPFKDDMPGDPDFIPF